MKKPSSPYFENVLLIDDEEIDNLINERLIQAAYFAKNVHTRTSIPAALGFLYKAIETGQNIPNVIFLDMNLPQYDGFHFLMEYKQMQYKYEELRNTSVVVLSAFLRKYPEHLLNSYSFIVDKVNKPLKDVELNELKEKIGGNWALSA